MLNDYLLFKNQCIQVVMIEYIYISFKFNSFYHQRSRCLKISKYLVSH